LAVEQVHVLAPLPWPEDEDDFEAVIASPAVEVFTRRARAVNAGFQLNQLNAAAIGEICRRLDGLPLALELAGARVRSMAPAQIADHLDERFRLLRQPHREVSGRARNLEDAVRWSHELLSDEERYVFDRLSVFAGSFTSKAAAAVTDRSALDTSDVLDALVERSMIVVVPDADQARYGLLETIRAFARQSLEATGDEADAIERHRRHYLEWAEAAATGVQGPEEARWVNELHRDLANLRAMHRRAAAVGDVDTCLRLAVALFDYAFFRMQTEVGAWAAEAIALPDAQGHPLFSQAAAVAGYLAWERGALDEAVAHAQTALDAGRSWLAHDALATVAFFQGRVEDAIAGYREAEAVALADGNAYRQAIALGQLAFAEVFAGGSDAIELATAAQAAAADSGNPSAIAHASWSMGIALFDRDPARALDHLGRSIELSREVDNRMALGAAATPAEQLRTKLSKRTMHEALVAALEQLEYWVEARNAPNMWGVVREMARSFAAIGRYEWAAIALGADAAATLKLPLREREQTRHDAVIAEVRGGLGNELYEHHAARGAAMTPEQLVETFKPAIEATGDA
jgi:hypothetical protein